MVELPGAQREKAVGFEILGHREPVLAPRTTAGRGHRLPKVVVKVCARVGGGGWGRARAGEMVGVEAEAPSVWGKPNRW